MEKSKKAKTYSELTYKQKVRKNWNKSVGLQERHEYSVAIIRCAISLELAVNYVIFKELVEERKLPEKLVLTLMQKANGIKNKYSNLLMPLLEKPEDIRKFKEIWKKISKVNAHRNRIAHSGEFKRRSTGEDMINISYAVLIEIFEHYGENARLKLPSNLSYQKKKSKKPPHEKI